MSMIKQSQFHYGSIKTKYREEYIIDEIQSQFHYGSIKTYHCALGLAES